MACRHERDRVTLPKSLFRLLDMIRKVGLLALLLSTVVLRGVRPNKVGQPKLDTINEPLIHYYVNRLYPNTF